MKRPAQKRAPHGATTAMVLDALVRLHTRGKSPVDVSRVDLLSALRLPETTVDDRLRTLVKDGRALRIGRALYVPVPWPCQKPRRSELPGTLKLTHFPDGAVLEEKWS